MLFDVSPNNITYDNFNYSAFVTYDQGSNSIRVPLSWWDQFNEVYGSLGGVPGFAYLYIFLIAILTYNFSRKRIKQKRKRFADEIMNNLLMIRSTIKSDQNYRSILEEINTKNISGFSWKEFQIVDTNLRTVFEPQDYIIIDDFNTILKLRNRYISNNILIDENMLQKLNGDCLRYAEKALKVIDWKKYSS